MSWAEEVTRYILFWTVFVGAGVISREGAHVSMEALYNIWPERLQRVAFLAINIFCIATIVTIFFFGIDIVKRALEEPIRQMLTTQARKVLWCVKR
jgi:C4-dicarboxylate transporter DctQ subunit